LQTKITQTQVAFEIEVIDFDRQRFW
jgi:hypothetical protein